MGPVTRGTIAPPDRQWLQDFANQQWREAMHAKLRQCGATDFVADYLLRCGVPWTLESTTEENPHARRIEVPRPTD